MDYDLLRKTQLNCGIFEVLDCYVRFTPSGLRECIGSEELLTVCSYNDSEVVYNPNHIKFGAVVEIFNPYLKDGFAILPVEQFQELTYQIKGDIDLVDCSRYQSLTDNEKDRSDYEDSKEYW